MKSVANSLHFVSQVLNILPYQIDFTINSNTFAERLNIPGGFNYPKFLPPTSGILVPLRFLFRKRLETSNLTKAGVFKHLELCEAPS